MSMDTDEAEVNLEAMTEEEQVTNVKILKWKVVIKVSNFFNLFLIHLLISIIWQRDLLFNNFAGLYLLWFISSTRILTPIVVSISFTTPRLILSILYISRFKRKSHSNVLFSSNFEMFRFSDRW
jgi:hypothetical protein